MNTHTLVMLTHDVGSTPAGTTGYVNMSIGLPTHPMKYQMVLDDDTIINVTLDDIRYAPEKENKPSFDFGKFTNEMPDLQGIVENFLNGMTEEGFTVTQTKNDTWSFYDRYASSSLFNFNGYEIIFAITSPFTESFALMIGSDGGFDDDVTIALINCRNNNHKTWEYLNEDEVGMTLDSIGDLIYDAANPFKRAQNKQNKNEETF